MIAALDAALDDHLQRSDLSAVLLDAEGPHFSFGASVEEHLPGKLRGDAQGAASPDPAHRRSAGAGAGRRARQVPRRRARGRARRPPAVRRAGRDAGPAGDAARRVRAGGLVPSARSDRPAARPRPARLRTHDQRRRGSRLGAGQRGRQPTGAAALRYFDAHLSRRAPRRCATPCAPRASTTWRASRPRCGGRAPVPRGTDDDPRCDRRTQGVIGKRPPQWEHR